jgi:DNA-directed RNA polymerase subunit H (RpoH/RPB5)
LSDDEAIDFKNKYGINFGTLFTSEAIARFYDYKPGNIIKIIRMNDSIGYRVVKYKILKKPMK